MDCREKFPLRYCSGDTSLIHLEKKCNEAYSSCAVVEDSAPGSTAQTGTALILIGLSVLILLAAFQFKRR